MKDRPIPSEWLSVVVVAALAFWASIEPDLSRWIFVTIAGGWAMARLALTKTILSPWISVGWLGLAIVSGLSTVRLAHPNLGLALCGLALMLALAARPMEPINRWALASIALTAALIRASGGDFGPNVFVEWLVRLGLDQNAAWIATIVVRKLVHFVFFAAVAFTALRTVSGLVGRGGIVWSLVWTLFHAALDETRQNFVPGRTGSAVDVLIDMAGALTVLIWYARFNEGKVAMRPTDAANRNLN